MTRIREEEEVFRWHYVCMLYRFWDIQRQRMPWPWNRRKVIENGVVR